MAHVHAQDPAQDVFPEWWGPLVSSVSVSVSVSASVAVSSVSLAHREPSSHAQTDGSKWQRQTLDNPAKGHGAEDRQRGREGHGETGKCAGESVGGGNGRFFVGQGDSECGERRGRGGWDATAEEGAGKGGGAEKDVVGRTSVVVEARVVHVPEEGRVCVYADDRLVASLPASGSGMGGRESESDREGDKERAREERESARERER